LQGYLKKIFKKGFMPEKRVTKERTLLTWKHQTGKNKKCFVSVWFYG